MSWPLLFKLYEALATALDDKIRAKLITEAIERIECLEERYPHLPDLILPTPICVKQSFA